VPVLQEKGLKSSYLTSIPRKKMASQSNYGYYKFFCKCGHELQSFPEFLSHLKDYHQIEEVNMSEILASGNGRMVGIKFYWHLSCQCGHQFSSSLCNADLKVKPKKIVLVRKYRLQCLKCDQNARFDREKLLTKFLKERVKQRLIYSFYRKKFAQFNGEHSDKKLKGHIQDLCEKCKSLGRYCGAE
ncbi:1131_t:CDS:1, partial [Racocetra fulgida]